MMEQGQLRKADLFSGTAIVMLGVFIIFEAMKMPMQDSYGGVQNVWYVSPALFPLLIGGMLILLGVLLCRTALKTIGRQGLMQVFSYLASADFGRFLRQEQVRRFYAIVINLVVFVFLLVPRIDFFLAAVLFLLVFFTTFYCSDASRLNRLIVLVCGASALLLLFFLSGLAESFQPVIPHPADWLVIIMTLLLAFTTRRDMVRRKESLRPLRLSIIIAVAAPFTIGVMFKYFLLVPMPHEGLVVSLLDAIWYADFWS